VRAGLGREVYAQYADPRYPEASAKPTDSVPPLSTALAQQYLDMELYRIFYPGARERPTLCSSNGQPRNNPWYVRGCA
jgi:hypothetical protein